MNVLVIGGTRFLGRHLTRRLLDAGHDVTLFHRGNTEPDGIEGTKNVLGDRDASLERAGHGYDAIVDTCGYVPSSVAASAEHFLRAAPDAVYAFVSTVSVYRDPIPPDADERAPRHNGCDSNATTVTAENYGALKAGCEDAVTARYGGAALIVRPGLIAGPYDPTDRFTYWVRRMSGGGAVLAPGDPQRRVQFVDVRDVAGFVATALERRIGGAFNVTGPEQPSTFAELLRTCGALAETSYSLHWATDDLLLRAGIVPWSGLPLWIPAAEARGFNEISSAAARAAGLRYRSVAETVADTLAWDRRRGQPALTCGLSRQTEDRLLEEMAGGGNSLET